MTPTTYTTNADHSLHKHLFCWRSAIAGLFLSLVVFIGVLALAMAFGGIGLYDGTTAGHATAFAAISLIIATVLATFVGGYMLVRFTRTRVDVLGAAQAAILSSVFLVFLVFQVISIAGTLGKAAAQTLGATAAVVGAGATAASQNPMIQDIAEDTFGDVKTKDDVATVAKGLGRRLVNGDTESAKNYLAYQTGMTSAQADAKIAELKAKTDEAMKKSREAAAQAMKATGWSLFVLIVLGMIGGVLGGALATRCNEKYTIDTPDEVKARK